MSELTASEWTYDTPDGKRDFCVLRGDEGMVGVVYREEDARLIAAAPEMYQWIENAYDFLLQWRRYFGDEDEYRSHWSEFCSTYHELLIEAELLFERIDGKEGETT